MTDRSSPAGHEPLTITVPKVIWALGDPVQWDSTGVTVVRRPLYYKGQRVGEIDPEYAEPLMKVLLKVKR